MSNIITWCIANLTLPCQLVPKESAAPPGQAVMRVMVPKDHVDMNKFESEHEPGFRTVVDYMTAIVKKVRDGIMEAVEAEQQQESEADKRLREGPFSA